MDEIRRCKNCDTRLLEHENRCPVCGTIQIDEQENIDFLSENASRKSYWRNPVIWIIAIILVIVSTLINSYLNKKPIDVADTRKISEEKYQLNIKGETDYYAQATNINMLGISYVNKENVYIMMNRELLVYDKEFKNREMVTDSYLTSFSEDDEYYYYLDESNNYCRIEKQSKKEDILLTNVYYVHNLEDKVYYQKDSDNESIHCLDLKTNEDVKINEEISYSLIVDENRERIFYINDKAELISIAGDGSDRKALASNTHIYTYDGEYLYYINDKGLIKCNLDGEHSEVYEKSNLKIVNIVNEHLVVHDNNIIYIMNKDGENVKKLYSIETTGSLTFEVVGDKLLVLTSSYHEGNVGYEIISLDGKRQILESDTTPKIIGEEI